MESSGDNFMAGKAIKSSLRSLAKYPIPLTKRELKAYNNGTKVFINSLPKSGTFLLRRTLSLLPTFAPRWSYHGLVPDTPQLERKIQNIRQGQYVSGHLYWSLELIELLVTSNICTLFIIRDLRDVAVSLANYLTYKEPNHRLHPYFKSLKSDRERLMAAIVGVDGKLLKDGRKAESLGEWAKGFAPWLNEPNCLAVRFEDLIGSAGGGDDERQLKNVRAIINYLDINISEEQITKVAQEIFFKSSTTFNKGQIGDWQNHFTDEHKCAFKKVAGEALINLGYEHGYDW
jgi:sulfotransferase 6B1